jgi:hypothetical protein
VGELGMIFRLDRNQEWGKMSWPEFEKRPFAATFCYLATIVFFARVFQNEKKRGAVLFHISEHGARAPM